MRYLLFKGNYVIVYLTHVINDVTAVAQDQYVEVDFLNLNSADPAINGYVFDSNTNGVPNVTVNLYKVSGVQNKWLLLNYSTQRLQAVITDITQKYKL